MMEILTSCSASAILFLSQDPCCAGVTVIGEVNAWTSNVMNLIWLIGTFTFAVVLAVVTEDIVATVLVSQGDSSLIVPCIVKHPTDSTNVKACTTNAMHSAVYYMEVVSCTRPYQCEIWTFILPISMLGTRQAETQVDKAIIQGR